jgi:hypothetical protein
MCAKRAVADRQSPPLFLGPDRVAKGLRDGRSPCNRHMLDSPRIPPRPGLCGRVVRVATAGGRQTLLDL